jgi:hypothetical protein
MKNQLPKNWSDVKLYQFQELKEANPDDFDSDVELIIEQICILSGIDPDNDEFGEMEFDELLDIMKSISWVLSEPPLNYSNKLGDYKLKNINKLKFGEFIDLEAYFSDNYIKNLHLICAILYKNTKVDEWGNVIEEPYIYDIYSRSEMYMDIPISMIYGVIKYYLDFKELIMDKYHIIFDYNGDDIEDTEGLSEEEIVEIKQEIEADKKKAKWSWPALINKLADGDVTKYDAITDLPLAFILNELSMRKIMDI